MRLKLAAWLCLSLAAVTAGFGTKLFDAELFGLKAVDLQFRLFADPRRADGRIILVEVDQASLDHFEEDNMPFPWPRSLYNPLIEYCAAGGAKAILFDIIFNNMSPYGVEIDEDFAAAVRKAGMVTLAAAFSQVEGKKATDLPERFGLPLSGAVPGGIRKKSASLPLPVFLEAVHGVGSVTNRPDIDGVFRKIEPFVEFAGRMVPSLAAAPLMTSSGEVKFGPRGLSAGEVTIPTDGEGRMWIRYHGPRGTYRRVSAAAVISSALGEKEGLIPAVPKEDFRDAYVLVGYAAPGIYDLKPTPLSSRSPGTEIHAAALDNLVNGDFMKDVPAWVSLAAAFAGAAAVSAAVLFVFRIPVSAAAALSALALLVVGAGLSFRGGHLLDLMTAGSSMLFSLIGSSVYRYQSEGKQRRFIAGALSRYVSPHVLKELTAHPEKLSLGGTRENLTLLFSDMKGFTTLSERHSPEEVVQFLNWHMSAMTRIIHRNHGWVQKFLGDGIYAFWGVPSEDTDHALHACRAAVQMQEENLKIQEEPFAERFPEVGLRIGINTGSVVVGNTGSSERFDYCPIGDSVNLAARLEGINKLYGTGILMSGATVKELEGRLAVRPVDRVRVKGKTEAIEIFTSCPDPTLAAMSERAIEAYRRREWAVAETLWEELLLKYPGDTIAPIYLARIEQFKEDPPGEDWDGAVSLEKV